MLVPRLLGGAAATSELRDAWNALFDASPNATPFQSWGWQSAWWRHFGKGKSPRTIAVYEGTDLVGLMPLAYSVGIWRTLRPAGVGPSDYLHPLVRDGYEEAVGAVIDAQMAGVAGVDLIDLHQVRETRALGRPASVGFEQSKCLVLDLPQSFEAYEQMLGKSLRYDVRKAARRPELDVQFDEPNALEILFDLHRKRWRRRGLPGAFFGRTLSFHRDWTTSDPGSATLGIVRHEGLPIGAIYAMRAGRSFFYYQAGFDPEFKAYSPGTAVVAAAIRRAIEGGYTQFDFMRGDEPYKRRWKPQHVYANRRLLLPSPGVRGQAALAWNLAGSRVEHRVRARLEGKGLV